MRSYGREHYTVKGTFFPQAQPETYLNSGCKRGQLNGFGLDSNGCLGHKMPFVDWCGQKLLLGVPTPVLHECTFLGPGHCDVTRITACGSCSPVRVEAAVPHQGNYTAAQCSEAGEPGPHGPCLPGLSRVFQHQEVPCSR